MKAIILAGGRGSRLYPYTTVLPKPLMPVGDVPILEHLFRNLKKHGITEVMLATGYLGELIESYCGNGSKLGMNITYSRETHPMGTAAPISLMAEKISETFLVMNGDLLCDIDFKELLEYHISKRSCVTIGAFNQIHKIGLGVLNLDNDNNLICYEEKPEYRYLVSMGIYVMEPIVLNYLKLSEKMDLPNLINLLIKEKNKVAVYKHNGYWLDIGTHKDLDKAVKECEGVFNINK